MMKSEKLIKWQPLPRIPATFFIKNFIYHDGNGLTLEVQEIDNKSAPILTIDFDCFFALRITRNAEELMKSYSVNEAVIKTKDQKSYYDWSLFMVENSQYLEWFHEENVDIRRDIDIAHYLIRTPDEVIEVLDLKYPTLMWN